MCVRYNRTEGNSTTDTKGKLPTEVIDLRTIHETTLVNIGT
jgi:hypothetical protein